VTTTATGHAVVTILGNTVTWKVDVDTPIDSLIAGHIHRRAADSVAGNVRVDFTLGQRVWATGPTGPGITGTVAQGSTKLVAPDDSVLAVSGWPELREPPHEGASGWRDSRDVRAGASRLTFSGAVHAVRRRHAHQLVDCKFLPNCDAGRLPRRLQQQRRHVRSAWSAS